jgi:cyanate permease
VKHTTPRRRTGIGAIFALPLAIAAASAIGLISALTGDGWRDAISWIGLAAPVAATGWAVSVRRG